MDRLLSAFGLYEFVSLVFTGAALLCGVWWAAAGVPDEPGAATVIALIAASFVVGHAVQATGSMWESGYWRRRGGWPSAERMREQSPCAYPETFRAVILEALAARHGDSVRQLRPDDLFGLARADLRAAGADGRAEVMNALYGMSRGFATVSVLLAAVFAVKWIDVRGFKPWGIALLIALVAGGLFAYRFHRFGYFFADQVWRDAAAFAVRPSAADSPAAQS